jgi:phosphatidate cytidylyltransferase
MKRLLTAAVGVPIVLAALFFLPAVGFFLFMAVVLEGAAFEYVAIVRPRAPHAPLALLFLLVPLAGAGLAYALSPGRGGPQALYLLAAFLLASVGIASLVLFARVPLEETIASLGILGFGTPYLALPLASICLLQQRDPWLVFLLMAIVWLGDTAAFYAGSRWGRHRMAPTISPKKSWEGAAAGFAISLAAAAVWSFCRLGRVDPGLLGVAAVTAVAAQVGDLAESMIKRGSGIKDSGNLLPGHGGVLDRMDAMLFAAPVLFSGVLLGVVPSLPGGPL